MVRGFSVPKTENVQRQRGAYASVCLDKKVARSRPFLPVFINNVYQYSMSLLQSSEQARLFAKHIMGIFKIK